MRENTIVFCRLNFIYSITAQLTFAFQFLRHVSPLMVFALGNDLKS